MKNILYFLIFILSLTSCKAILMKSYGINSPDIENRVSILRSANKYKLDTANFFTVSSEFYLRKLKEVKSFPDASIYSTKGDYIEYRETDTSCNAGLYSFIPKLRKDSIFKLGIRETLQKEIIKYRDLDGKEITNIFESGYDFYITIFQTVWTGKLNKDHVKIWENLANENQKSKIKIIKVNLDIQQYWDEIERKKIINKLEGK